MLGLFHAIEVSARISAMKTLGDSRKSPVIRASKDHERFTGNDSEVSNPFRPEGLEGSKSFGSICQPSIV